MQRIVLLFGTNLAIVGVMFVVLQLLGLDQLLEQKGFTMSVLLGITAFIGITGAIISLVIAKWMAKRTMGVHLIELPRNPKEIWLTDTVRRQATAAGIAMPEVGIFESPDMNSFATGAHCDAALVAVSSTLLNVMSPREAEAVLAHEISHIANGDMVTLTLIQGVVNTFVIFPARVIGTPIDTIIGGTGERRRGSGPVYLTISMALQLVLGILATMIVAWFSRIRELRADLAGVKLSNRQNTITALERLQTRRGEPLPRQLAPFGIAGGKLANLFASHPPLDVRIAALRNAA
jgi:heat shock protein HtpX